MKKIKITLVKPKILVKFTPKSRQLTPSTQQKDPISTKIIQSPKIITKKPTTNTPNFTKTPQIKPEPPSKLSFKVFSYQDNYFYKTASLPTRQLINQAIQAITQNQNFFSPKSKITLKNYQFCQFFIKFQVPELFFADLGNYLEKTYITKIYLTYRNYPLELQKSLLQNCNEFLLQNRQNLLLSYLNFTQKHVTFGQNLTDQTASQYNASGPFLGVAVCSGIAKLATLLLRMAKQDVLTTVGHTQSGEFHAWNLAKLGQNWYVFDFTWCLRDQFPRYYCVSDDEIKHKSEYQLPKCVDKKKSYLAVNWMVSERESEVVQCFLRQVKNGKVCVRNDKIGNYQVFEIVKEELLKYNRQKFTNFEIRNVNFSVRNQTSFECFQDPKYICFQSNPRINVEKTHIIYVFGDLSIKDKLLLKQLIGCKKQLKIEIRCIQAQDVQKIIHSLNLQMFSISFETKKYVEMDNIQIIDNKLLFQTKINPAIIITSAIKRLAKGKQFLIRATQKEIIQANKDKQLEIKQCGLFSLVNMK